MGQPRRHSTTETLHDGDTPRHQASNAVGAAPCTIAPSGVGASARSPGRAESHDESKRAPRSVAGLPASTPQAEAFAKRLKSRGYRFVGPASVYAFLQNTGVVNDHVHGCFRATDYPGAVRRR
ncbi:DNA-3-methyladenine glycosylase I [Streptomyces sp. NPDC008092]|uniref:DNA-3-methyladenine glycosylase I n=1 Tax=Streptomyces sp. NPDC008092 TaxID=3364808 RepID=UPI0036EFE024